MPNGGFGHEPSKKVVLPAEAAIELAATVRRLLTSTI
jgi:hypothetical protein